MKKPNTQLDRQIQTQQTNTEGVGGRHKETLPPSGGGGSLNSCNISEVDSRADCDPRLSELAAIGLPALWFEVAIEIGFDNFMTMWAALDSAPSVQNEQHRVYVPRFSTWTRWQRNRYILTLHQEGLRPDEIKSRLSIQTGDSVSLFHITRIIKKNG